MMDNKKLRHFTLIDVIKRKIHFINTNTIFDKANFKNNNEGELLAYHQMLVDVKEMDEIEFVNKYLNIVKKITAQFENGEIKDKKEIEKMSGYNNAIVSILKCIHPIHEFEIEE